MLKKNGTELNYSPEEILRMLFGIFLAASINTIMTFAWMTLYLAMNPKYADVLREELKSITFDTLESITNLPFMDRVRLESGRLSSSTTVGLRYIIKDTEYEGFVLPQSEIVVMLTAPMYRDPTLFKDPDTFNPDRFLDQSIPKVIPFGAGVHRCKGEVFALEVVKVCLGVLFKNYDVKLVGEPPVRTYLNIFPRFETKVKITRKTSY